VAIVDLDVKDKLGHLPDFFRCFVELVTYLMKSEHDKAGQLFVDITGGRKTASIGALLGVFKNVSEVEEVFCVTEEETAYCRSARSLGSCNRPNTTCSSWLPRV